MASLIAIPFLIGSVPIGLAVVGANHILKQKRMTDKFLYWCGITASAFGGWVVSNRLMTLYESQVLSAENPDMVYPRMPTRLIVAIDTSASTVMDYKGRFSSPHHKYPLTTEKRQYPLAKKYETMAKNMVKILQPDDVVFLDWNGQGVRYYDETKQSYNGTGSYKSIAEFIKGEGLDDGDYLTTTVTITDAPMASFREFRAESKFKEPYMKGDKLDMKRGNDGRFRRRLVIPLKKNADTFNSDSHTDSFMADYKDKFKNWKPSAYPYEKRITQDSDNEACNSCGEEKVHYQFYLAQKNSRYPKIRFLDGATYCQYDTNTCGGNICGDCAENASCENCGAEICTYCENEDNYDHADLVCVDCREFNESLEDD
tara:strand:- start:408 stop:1520 length:1113 start_codon:yes stop_codon:yes gene_type:complete